MLRSGYLGFGVPAVGKALGITKPPNHSQARGLLVRYGLLVGCHFALEVPMQGGTAYLVLACYLSLGDA